MSAEDQLTAPLDATEAASLGEIVKEDDSASDPAAADAAAMEGAPGVVGDGQSRKRALEDADASQPKRYAPAAGSVEGPCMKMLVSNSVAGGLIGRGGAIINELQRTTGCRVKLSQAKEVFPGTQERVVLLQGAPQSLQGALEFIMGRVCQAETEAVQTGQFPDVTASAPVRLAVSNQAAGLIIGRGGEVIRQLQEASGAQVHISNKDEIPGVSERIVSLTGQFQTKVHCALLILQKLLEDPSSCQYQNMSTAYRNAMGMGGGGMGMGGGFGQPQQGGYNPHDSYRGYAGQAPVYGQQQAGAYGAYGAQQQQQYGHYQQPQMGGGGGGYQQPMAGGGGPGESVTVPISDELVGPLVGRGGQIITEIQRVSGARVKISQKGDYLPGTRNRTVTITGPPTSVAAAHTMVVQRIEEATMAAQVPR